MKKKKFLLLIINFLLVNFVSIQSAQFCKVTSKGKCTFNTILTNESHPYFKPVADHPENVIEISLSSKMEILTNEICMTFSNLKVLNAKFLQMREITDNALNKCKNLSSAWLNRNNLTELPDELFKYNTELKFLYLYDNLLIRFNPKMFLNTKKLMKIDLGENYISYFPINKFPQLNELQELHINRNKLIDLDEKEMMKKFPKLKTVFMEDNPFQCTRLAFIVEKFSKSGIATKAEYSVVRQNKGLNLTNIGNLHCLHINVQSFDQFYLKHVVVHFFKLEENYESELSNIKEVQKDILIAIYSIIAVISLIALILLCILMTKMFEKKRLSSEKRIEEENYYDIP